MPAITEHTAQATDKNLRWRPFALKLLISTCWLLLLLEIVPRFLFSTSLLTHGIARWALVGYDESSWRLLWVMRHRLNLEQTITPTTATLPRTGECTTYDSSRGWAVKPNVRNMTPFGPGKFV